LGTLFMNMLQKNIKKNLNQHKARYHIELIGLILLFA